MVTSNVSLLSASVLLVILLALYGYVAVRTYEKEEMKGAGIANPAAVHCTNIGGTVEIRTDQTGAESGYCVLPDGRVCEEWSFFRDGVCASAL